jgi:hypothetical protein
VKCQPVSKRVVEAAAWEARAVRRRAAATGRIAIMGAFLCEARRILAGEIGFVSRICGCDLTDV